MNALPVRYLLPDSLPKDAPAADHAAWCENFERFCRRHAALAREFNMPCDKWTKAANYAAVAAAAWRERAGATP